MKYPWILNVILGIMLCLPVMVLANQADYVLTIKDHQFTPSQLMIPANTKVKIVVENQDATPEEFESFQLNREKVISGNSKGIIYIGPLKPGTYKYFGDFHQNTAKGEVVAK